MKKSGTGMRGRQSALPAPRHLPLVAILVDAQAELQELVVASGLKVLAAMLEADRVAVCGPRNAHQPARRASRAGHAPSEVVPGGPEGRPASAAGAARRPGGRAAIRPGLYEHGSAHPARGRPDAHRRGHAPVWPESRTAGCRRPHAGHTQACRASAVGGADAGATRCVAGAAARRPRAGGTVDRWGPRRRPLYRRGAGSR